MRKTFLLWTACSALAFAQAAPDRRQAILDYQLTMPRANQLISAMTAMTKHVAAMPDYKERLAKTMKMTPAEQLAQIEKDPEAMAILKSNNLTTREYLIGVPALHMAHPGGARDVRTDDRGVPRERGVREGQSSGTQAEDGCC